jgi:hypothetical protein
MAGSLQYQQSVGDGAGGTLPAAETTIIVPRATPATIVP